MALGNFKSMIKPSWDHRNALPEFSTGKASNSNLDFPTGIILKSFVQTIGWDIWDGTPTATQDLIVNSQNLLILHSELEFLLHWIHSWLFQGAGGRISVLHMFKPLCSVSCGLSGFSLPAFGTGAFISSLLLNCLFGFLGTCAANTALPHNSQYTASACGMLFTPEVVINKKVSIFSFSRSTDVFSSVNSVEYKSVE